MSLLDDLRQQLKTALDQRATHEARRDEIIAAVEARNDKNLTEAETAEFTELRSKIATIDEANAPLRARIDEMASDADARKAADDLSRSIPTAPQSSNAARVTVRSEEPVYRPDGEHSFFADLYAVDMRRGDRAAEERIARHQAQRLAESRATTVSGMAGMVPPQFLTDLYAPNARAGRPFLNSLTPHPLPPTGTSFTIPRGSTLAVATLATEGSGFNDTDVAVTNDTPTVQLIGAKSDVSRTLFERGGPVVDNVIMPDLMAACDLVEDNTALNGTTAATSFLGVVSVSGINSVAYTDASPTVAELWPKLADAIQRVNSLRFMPATAIYMHPRRWGWITSALDTAGRPLFNFSTTPPPNSVMGLGNAAEYGQVVGSIMGLPVITDANIATTWSGGAPGAGTEDYIVVGRTPDWILWEDPYMQFTFEQAPTTAPGQVRLAVGRFALFHAARYPKGIAVVGGTGLVTPTF